MNNNHSIISMILLAVFWTTPGVSADLKAGEEKSQMCLGCHGSGGKSNSPQWPNLAAQQETYLVNQLQAFKSGVRNNSMMENMAGNLSETDMLNLAAFFAKQPAAKAGGNPDLAKIGKDKSVMCQGCHGQSGEGNGQIPRLAGQHSEYLISQLKNFKSGERQSGHMQAIASTLSEDDMKTITAFFASLP